MLRRGTLKTFPKKFGNSFKSSLPNLLLITSGYRNMAVSDFGGMVFPYREKGLTSLMYVYVVLI